VERRSYEQYCAVARALDLIGERWTLLILRDLVHLGPRRFSDLRAGLPGIGANMLTQRLRRLEREGLVRRRKLPPPGASVVVYELTDLGAGLEPTLIELGRWGGALMGDRGGDVIFPSGHISAIRASFRADEARDVRARYEFRIEGQSFNVEIDDGAVTAALGPAVKPDLVIVTDTETSIDLMMRRTAPRAAVQAGAVAINGTVEELEHAIDLLAWIPAETGAQSSVGSRG
jgi:DNA-binding HxlR family transcriptional regulator